GLAGKADLWLQVRPGTDGALALGIASAMIERNWYDRAFARDWTNGPLLVRSDNGRLLTEADLTPVGSARSYVAWDTRASRPLLYDASLRRYEQDGADPALSAALASPPPHGPPPAPPASAPRGGPSRRYTPALVESLCGVTREQVE